ncbi:unnamed protein product [Moneuplotes crassus]|uniref:Uncharacterized protein n=1 Tax=Euplotes crassus TaxID=5936 RepID=A0AAD1U3J2_EUPCR|nr:unnamed protein product [Moneuplotes crassus]
MHVEELEFLPKIRKTIKPSPTFELVAATIILDRHKILKASRWCFALPSLC